MSNADKKNRAAADASTLTRAARRLAVLIALPLLALVGQGVLAAEYCVGTTSELNAAFSEVVSPYVGAIGAGALRDRSDPFRQWLTEPSRRKKT